MKNKSTKQAEQNMKSMAKLSLTKMINKKALSNVVVAVLLILLAIASIVIIWQVVKNQINKAQFSPDQLCLNPEIKITRACYNGQEVEIKLSRLPQQEINELDFALNYADKSDVYSCNNNCNNCLILASGTKTYYITAAKPNSVTIKYGNCLETKQVEDC